MSTQDVADYINQQWVLHGPGVHDWIVDHAWTVLLIAALLFLKWVRDEKRQGRL